MKKKLLFIALVISSIFHAQLPSSSEKWNSTFQRYDIYDSSGTLIGYKNFNQAFGRWETYDFRPNNKQNNNNNSGWDEYTKAKTRNRSVPDLEYPTLSSSDIEYARILAQSNVNRENAERERYAEKNLKILQNKVDEYFSTIRGWSDVDQDVKDKMTEEFNERINIGNRRYTDLSQKSTADAAWYYYRDTYNELLEKYINGPNRKRREELSKENERISAQKLERERTNERLTIRNKFLSLYRDAIKSKNYILAKEYHDNAVLYDVPAYFTVFDKPEILFYLERYSECLLALKEPLQWAYEDNLQNKGRLLYFQGVSKIKLNDLQSGCQDLTLSIKEGFEASISAKNKFCKK